MAEAEGKAPTSEPIAALAQRLLTHDASLVASLEGVAAAGCSLVDGCVAASITIIEVGRPITIASTGPLATAMDEAQYEADDGPCLAAAREEHVIEVPRASEEARWPEFAQAASRSGVGSALSVPMVLPGPDVFGGINCYAEEPEAFADHDRRIVDGFAAQAAVVVANTLAYWAAFDQAANLTKAMEHRAVIEQAKGILMARQRCTAEEAFEILRRASQRENRKLRDLAAEIVARTSTPDPA